MAGLARMFDLLGKGGTAAFKGVGKAAGPAFGGLSLLLLAGVIKDLIGEVVDEDLSLKALFTGVGEEEEGRLTKKVKDIKAARKKSKVTKDLLREQFGAPETAIERAGPKAKDVLDIETIRKILPFAAARNIGFEDILGEGNVDSPIFQALNPKERKALRKAVDQPIQTAAQVMKTGMGG